MTENKLFRVPVRRTDESAFCATSIENLNDQLIFVDPRKLKPNPKQPRIAFDNEYIRELADSITKNGLLQPIVIAKMNDSDDYYIVVGENRTRASILAGFDKIKAILTNDVENEKNLSVKALIENIIRRDLHPIEVGLALQDLMLQNKYKTQAELIQDTGFDKSTISRYLSLCKLYDDTKTRVIKGQYKDLLVLTSLSKVQDPQNQLKAISHILSASLQRDEAISYIQTTYLPRDNNADKQNQNFTFKASKTRLDLSINLKTLPKGVDTKALQKKIEEYLKNVLK